MVYASDSEKGYGGLFTVAIILDRLDRPRQPAALGPPVAGRSKAKTVSRPLAAGPGGHRCRTGADGTAQPVIAVLSSCCSSARRSSLGRWWSLNVVTIPIQSSASRVRLHSQVLVAASQSASLSACSVRRVGGGHCGAYGSFPTMALALSSQWSRNTTSERGRRRTGPWFPRGQPTTT
jgi:hypothetical protein